MVLSLALTREHCGESRRPLYRLRRRVWGEASPPRGCAPIFLATDTGFSIPRSGGVRATFGLPNAALR
jgi:hypothetical protein